MVSYGQIFYISRIVLMCACVCVCGGGGHVNIRPPDEEKKSHLSESILVYWYHFLLHWTNNQTDKQE